MVFTSVLPKNAILRSYVQRIFFITSSKRQQYYTSFPNDNVSLCIVNGKQVVPQGGKNLYQEKSSITSYLVGLDTKPNSFETDDPLDEICIEFTTAGSRRFLPFLVKQRIFNDCVIGEAFGKNALYSLFSHS